MTSDDLTINNLLKVALVLEAGPSRDDFKPLAESKKLEFIYGVAACGITPFEKLLYLKSSGEKVSADVDMQKAEEYFGPLSTEILSWLPERGKLHFKAGIQAVSQPENREIIKALASGGGCGGDCDCGCGCD